LKTYTIAELEATRKTGLDYAKEHEKMLLALKSGEPREEVGALWDVPQSQNPFWTVGNVLNREEEGYTPMEGVGRVNTTKQDD